MIWLIWAYAQAGEEPWFLEHPLTVTTDGVGGTLQVRVSHAAGDYWVMLSDPNGTTRRTADVTPSVGVYFTYTADLPGIWTVSVGYPFATGVSAAVEFTLSPGASRRDDDGDSSCGLLGLEAIMFYITFRGWRHRTRQISSI